MTLPAHAPGAEAATPRLGPPGRFHAVVDAALPRGGGPAPEQVRTILERLPPLIGTRILAGPFVVQGMPYNPGLTGFAVLDLSHLCVHTYAEHRVVMVDILSCRPYDLGVVRRFLAGSLDVPPGELNLRVVSWE